MEDGSMTLSKPQFVNTISTGQIAISLPLMAILGLFVSLIQWKGDVDNQIKLSQAARDKYIPIVESIVKSDILQDQRMNNFAEAIGGIRQSQATIIDKIGDIKSTVAVIEERTKEKKGQN